ncbi:hypothetical protein YC2023_077228 [Brassica napus]
MTQRVPSKHGSYRTAHVMQSSHGRHLILAGDYDPHLSKPIKEAYRFVGRLQLINYVVISIVNFWSSILLKVCVVLFFGLDLPTKRIRLR